MVLMHRIALAFACLLGVGHGQRLRTARNPSRQTHDHQAAEPRLMVDAQERALASFLLTGTAAAFNTARPQVRTPVQDAPCRKVTDNRFVKDALGEDSKTPPSPIRKTWPPVLTTSVRRIPDIQMVQSKEVSDATAEASLPSRFLPLLLISDVIAAALAAFPVSIPVKIIDAAIIQKMSCDCALVECLAISIGDLACEPLQFFDIAFAAVFSVHLAGFTAANVADTVIQKILSRQDGQSDAAIKGRKRAALAKLALTSTANVVSSAKRDQLLARLYGSGPARAVPLICTLLFFLRDSLTMLCSFSLPKPLAEFVRRRLQWDGTWVSTATQILPVVLVQLFIMPMHLLAFAIYNGAADPLVAVRSAYWSSTLVRVVRTFFGWGLGGQVNVVLQKRLNQAVPSRPNSA